MRQRQEATPRQLPLPLLVACVLVGWSLLAAAGRVVAQPAVRVEPSAEEQLLIYELNRARSNPTGYAREQGLDELLAEARPLPPLAVNEWLTAAARLRADEMATHDYFDHRSAVTGMWPNELARSVGYPLPMAWPDDRNYIESLAAGYSTPSAALRALIEDAGVNPPGHRYHLLAMGPKRAFWLTHREVGVGYAFGATTTYGDYFVLQTAQPPTDWPYVTGVVYEDLNGNGRYDLHEGLRGVEVVALGSEGQVDSTTTNAAGGFSLLLLPGLYTLRFSGDRFVGMTEVDVEVERDNYHLAVQSAPAEPHLAVEHNFEHQRFEPLERGSDEAQAAGRNVAAGAANQQQQSAESAHTNGAAGRHVAPRGCSLGGGDGTSADQVTLGGLAGLLLLGLVVTRRRLLETPSRERV